jgi:hypothetical protein
MQNAYPCEFVSVSGKTTLQQEQTLDNRENSGGCKSVDGWIGSRLNHILKEEDKKIREKGIYQQLNNHDSCPRQIQAMHNVES